MSNSAAVKHAYIIAGEVSGDRLGGEIMQALRAKHEGIIFSGIGGPKMQEAGLKSRFDYSELALMGFAEILPKALHLLGRIASTVEDIEIKQPDVVITIDSPGFTFRVVEKARKAFPSAKFIHVVAPTVWAYKEKRAEKCAKLFDHMLTLLPFEPPYFEKAGLDASFIGHPTVSGARPRGDGARFRQKHHITPEQKIIALLPGSRENEVRRHIRLMSEVVDRLAVDHPGLVIVTSAPHHLRVMLNEYVMTSPHRMVLAFTHDEKMDAFAAADAALVKSGTVSLEMAYAGTPMAVMYKVNAITAWLVRRMVKTNYASLVNIILDAPIIPEFLQDDATAEALHAQMQQLLTDDGARKQQIDGFKRAVQSLQTSHQQPAAHAADMISTIMAT